MSGFLSAASRATRRNGKADPDPGTGRLRRLLQIRREETSRSLRQSDMAARSRFRRRQSDGWPSG